jgi:hypothetical protein
MLKELVEKGMREEKYSRQKVFQERHGSGKGKGVYRMYVLSL